ncbi:5546_t:CDS:2 [Funneliformis geosporum]|uniref:5546_t:CDS:1 n=1 Tax=Funneliformis geosporum TaxID=1117311 RepID=A0A9W4SAN1_9GLOM|nr:5546_t:CDS:2 [Funneliformis geosporum]
MATINVKFKLNKYTYEREAGTILIEVEDEILLYKEDGTALPQAEFINSRDNQEVEVGTTITQIVIDVSSKLAELSDETSLMALLFSLKKSATKNRAEVPFQYDNVTKRGITTVENWITLTVEVPADNKYNINEDGDTLILTPDDFAEFKVRKIVNINNYKDGEVGEDKEDISHLKDELIEYFEANKKISGNLTDYITKAKNFKSKKHFYELKTDENGDKFNFTSTFKDTNAVKNIANANGFIISRRIHANDSVITIGERDNGGNLTDNAKSLDNLDPDTTEGNANLAYLFNPANEEHTIIGGKYRGIKIFEDKQVVGKSDNSNNDIENDVSANPELCLVGRAASPSDYISKEDIEVFRQIFPKKDVKKDGSVSGNHGERLDEKITVTKSDNSTIELLPTRNFFAIHDAYTYYGADSTEGEKRKAAVNQAFYNANFEETYSREELLELYYFQLKTACGYSSLTDQADKDSIDKPYEETKKVLELLNFNPTGINQTEKDTKKTELTNYKEGTNGKPKFTGLAKQIQQKIDEIDGVISLDTHIDNAIAAATTANNTKAKSAYDKFKALPASDTNRTQEFFNELKKLVELLKTAGGDNQKEKTRLKAAIKIVLGKDDNAVFEEVIKDINTSEIDKAAQILEEAAKGEGKQKSDPEASTICNTLINLRNKNTKAWSAANKVKKAGDTQGYPEKILAQLNLQEGIEAIINEIGLDQADTIEKVEEKEQAFKSRTVDGETKKSFENIIFPRKKLAVKLEKKPNASQEEKKLGQLIEEFYKTVSLETDKDYSDNTSETQLKKLQEKLKQLKDYSEGSGKTKTVFDGLEPTEKTLITDLVKNIGERVSAMEQAQNKTEKKPDEPN